VLRSITSSFSTTIITSVIQEYRLRATFGITSEPTSGPKLRCAVEFLSSTFYFVETSSVRLHRGPRSCASQCAGGLESGQGARPGGTASGRIRPNREAISFLDEVIQNYPQDWLAQS